MKVRKKIPRSKKETQLQRVIRRSECGEIGYGDVTIRISICGYSITRFCKLRAFKKTLKEQEEVYDMLKAIYETKSRP